MTEWMLRDSANSQSFVYVAICRPLCLVSEANDRQCEDAAGKVDALEPREQGIGLWCVKDGQQAAVGRRSNIWISDQGYVGGKCGSRTNHSTGMHL